MIAEYQSDNASAAFLHIPLHCSFALNGRQKKQFILYEKHCSFEVDIDCSAFSSLWLGAKFNSM